ncbi:UNKNOWN [Stylonychia lemnae]|uniref:Uncharacterized protein n=1 Tax=Stylonychia lemnae TaxID=5949 RepID=A0A078AF42_STYLE|nr:UNKNOWN [Stylonychia lemnae]|eukprot:CDW79528.1 UNKNOWN [Stylonychia lemnae]
MLLTKFNKKYASVNEKGVPTTDFQTNQIINNEVLNFIRTEKLNRDNLKLLEAKIDQKLQNKNQKLTRLGSQSNNLKLNVNQLVSEEPGKFRSMSRINSKNGLLPQINNMAATGQNFLSQNQDQDVQEQKFSQTQDVRDIRLQPMISVDNGDGQEGYSQRTPLIFESPGHKREKDRSIKSELSNDDEWAEVDKYRKLIHERDLMLQKEKKEQQKQFTKTILDEQIKEKQQRMKQFRQEKQKNDGMVLNQVSEYKRQQELMKIEQQRKLLEQKQQRETQLQVVNDQKKAQKRAKKQYEMQLIDDFKHQIQTEKEKQMQKKEQLKERAEEMKKENEMNKAIKMENKMKQREQDVMMSKQYVEMVNEQERKKVEEFQKREKKISDFMSKLEKGALAEVNKKQAYLEEQIRKYEEKKQKEDYLDDERRRKKQIDRKEELKNILKDQMEEREMKKKFVKDMNNVYVQIFKDKHEREIEKEQQEAEILKQRQREVQEHVRKQIEEKKARGKGMTNDEFEFNKDLLKEIVTKGKQLRETVQSTQMHNGAKTQLSQGSPYEIYSL